MISGLSWRYWTYKFDPPPSLLSFPFSSSLCSLPPPPSLFIHFLFLSLFLSPLSPFSFPPLTYSFVPLNFTLTTSFSPQVRAISKDWASRAALPQHVVQIVNSFPSKLHPMAQFSAAITAMHSESKFAKGYSEGINKTEYWEV